MSGSYLDKGERIGIASVCEEVEEGVSSWNGENIGGKIGLKKLVGLVGFESKN